MVAGREYVALTSINRSSSVSCFDSAVSEVPAHRDLTSLLNVLEDLSDTLTEQVLDLIEADPLDMPLGEHNLTVRMEETGQVVVQECGQQQEQG